jgi:hypothetical protein
MPMRAGGRGAGGGGVKSHRSHSREDSQKGHALCCSLKRPVVERGGEVSGGGVGFGGELTTPTLNGVLILCGEFPIIYIYIYMIAMLT